MRSLQALQHIEWPGQSAAELLKALSSQLAFPIFFELQQREGRFDCVALTQTPLLPVPFELLGLATASRRKTADGVRFGSLERAGALVVLLFYGAAFERVSSGRAGSFTLAKGVATARAAGLLSPASRHGPLDDDAQAARDLVAGLRRAGYSHCGDQLFEVLPEAPHLQTPLVPWINLSSRHGEAAALAVIMAYLRRRCTSGLDGCLLSEIRCPSLLL